MGPGGFIARGEGGAGVWQRLDRRGLGGGGGRGRNGQEAGGWPVGGLSGCIELHWALVGGGR